VGEGLLDLSSEGLASARVVNLVLELLGGFESYEVEVLTEDTVSEEDTDAFEHNSLLSRGSIIPCVFCAKVLHPKVYGAEVLR
jgi:hypothetical protein